MKKRIGLLGVALILTACGASDTDSGPETESVDLLAPQREAIERAKDVEQVLDQAAERQRRLIDEQDG